MREGTRSRYARARDGLDEDLANRIRELLAHEDAVDDKAMFGGLAFLIHGHMCVAASYTGGLLARVDPASTDSVLAARPGAARMEMRGRSMDGWITVPPEGVKTYGTLAGGSSGDGHAKGCRRSCVSPWSRRPALRSRAPGHARRAIVRSLSQRHRRAVPDSFCLLGAQL